MKYNDRKGEIKFLVSKGHEIVEIEVGEASTFIYTTDFEAPNIGAIASAPYLTMKGIDITDFLLHSDFNQSQPTMFGERFQQLIDDRNKFMTFKFSDKHVWRHFS